MATRAIGTDAVWAFAEHEHLDLRRGINRIHDVACEIGHRPSPELSVHVLGVLQWLYTTLEPHIAWEEAWLYPQIDARTATPWATKAARFDHQQIREMAARLGADQSLLSSHPSGDQHAETCYHLFGLEALLRAHIEREERYLLPVLEEDWVPGQPGMAVARDATTG
jgi:iron-sulfur cluster repair protein YtfE (RIC family)